MLPSRNNYLRSLVFILCLSICFLTGCSPSGGSSSGPDDSDSDTPVINNMIGFSSNEELATYLKTQFSMSVHTDYSTALTPRRALTDNETDGGGTLPANPSNSFIAEKASDYTGTNLQEAGVDESDLVKTDGEYLYIASDDVLNIVRTADPMSIVGTITLDEMIDSLYLYNDMLIVLYSPAGYGGIPWIDTGRDDIAFIGIPYWIPIEVKTGIAFYDVSNPLAPIEKKRVEVDGYLVSSRRIENHLYVVQQFLPDLPPPDVLETEIQDMSLEDLVPFYKVVDSVDEVQNTQLVDPEDFYHPDINGGGSIVSIVSFDLDTPDLSLTSTGAVADASVVYASTEALYFTSTYWNFTEREAESPLEQTIVYKFGLENGQAISGGYIDIDGRVLNQFSLGEYNDVLRIATTTGSSFGSSADSKNHVYCIGPQSGNLAVIGSLEGLAPGEEIYAARFIGPRGYLVTFVTIDPLFTLDLSDPTAPEVAGELKVPGYSDYIHPFGDDYLICIGKDAIDEDGFAWYQGVQMTIFDISDFSNPNQLHTLIIGDRGTSSDALYNHKAFTFWESKGLLALPVELFEHQQATEYPYTYGELTFVGLYLYRVDTTDGFEFVGRISTSPGPDNVGYYYSRWTRGVFIGDTIHAVTPKAINSANLDNIKSSVESLSLETK